MKLELPDFDTMLKMAEEEPEALEELRQSLIEDIIEEAPEEHRRRLKGLQWQIDMKIQQSSNPMQACIKISEMMHESFGKLRDALNELQTHEITTDARDNKEE